MTIKRALISVWDKTGLLDLAHFLAQQGVEIIATGGTAALLEKNNIAVLEVSKYTGTPEMMSGRVKTLNPKIHGGILARRGIDDAIATEQGIKIIDLVVVNLYPFTQVIKKAETTLADAIENIDIGGPAMLRAAAKNHQFVSVVVEPNDYPALSAAIVSSAGITKDMRYQWASKAFAHSAYYDSVIASYLRRNSTLDNAELPQKTALPLLKKQSLRYGENPHQNAAYYRLADAVENQSNIINAEQRQGKALSFNNIADSDAALSCVRALKDKACVIVKHGNPCGAAQRSTALAAYQAAYCTDPTSAFGGIIAFNCTLDDKTAQAIINQQFVEVIIAAKVTPAAEKVIASKNNVRLLVCGELKAPPEQDEIKTVGGGILWQNSDANTVPIKDFKVMGSQTVSAEQKQDLWFAWQLVRFVKSNAIVYVKNQQTLGIGAGQTSRVISAQVAVMKAAEAKLTLQDAVMASDAFLPFDDVVSLAAKAGASAIVQPGGSINDDKVIATANQAKIAMVFTGRRHFKH